MAALFDGSPPAVSYETYATEGKGQGLRATKRIEINELIFKEEPFIWHSKIAKSDYACHSCGRYLRSTEGNRSLEIVRCTQSPTLCKAVYCNLACEQESLKNGHRFVCAGRSETFDAYIDQTNGDCHLSHSLRLLGIALVFYRRVAEFCYSRQMTGTTVSAMEAATHLLLGYQRVDYCRTVHALRCGQLDVDEEMFATMIAPAYFSSHLEVPLELIKEIMSNEDCWGTGVDGRRQADIFVNSEIFQPLFFRELMGSFAINNLEVRIQDENETAVDFISGAGIVTGDLSTNTDTGHFTSSYNLKPISIVMKSSITLTITSSRYPPPPPPPLPPLSIHPPSRPFDSPPQLQTH